MTRTFPANGTAAPWDGALQTYVDGGDGHAYTLDAATTDDTSAINAALAANVHVKGKKGENYQISSPLTIPSGTTLDMTGCTVTLKASSNCNMIRNTNYTGASRDSNITIRGGTWDRGANGGTTLDQNSIFLRQIDGLLVENINYKSTGGKSGVVPGSCTNFTIRNIHSDACNSALVQMCGPLTNGLVENITALAAGDDIVACTTTDYTGYDDVHGDISQLWIRNVYGGSPTRCVLLAGSANGTADGFTVKNVVVEQVRQTSSGGGVYLGAQVAGSTLTHDGIVIRGVRGGVVYLRAPHMGQVVVEDALAESSYAAVSITPEASPQDHNIVDRLTLRNCRSTGTGSDVLAALNSTSVIGQADLYACSTDSSGALASVGCSSVTGLALHDCESTGTNHVVTTSNTPTISSLVFNRLHATNPSSGKHVVYVNSALTLTTVSFNDPIVTAVDGSTGTLVYVNNTGATLGRVTVKGGRIDATRNILDHKSTSTSNVTYLAIADTYMTGIGRIFQASNVTLNFSYLNVVWASGVAQACYIYGGGALNIRGYGWSGTTGSSVVRSTTEVIHIIARDFPADASLLTGANGDTFTNTNTSVAPYVAAPVTRDSANANWIPIQGYQAAGTAVLVAGTKAVADTKITANSVIRLAVTTPGGTVGAPFVSVKTAGTGFTITSTSATDTSTVRYEVVSY